MTVAYIGFRNYTSDQQEWATVEHPPVLCTHVGQKKAMVNGKVEPGHSPAYSEPAGAERRTEASVELASSPGLYGACACMWVRRVGQWES